MEQYKQTPQYKDSQGKIILIATSVVNTYIGTTINEELSKQIAPAIGLTYHGENRNEDLTEVAFNSDPSLFRVYHIDFLHPTHRGILRDTQQPYYILDSLNDWHYPVTEVISGQIESLYLHSRGNFTGNTVHWSGLLKLPNTWGELKNHYFLGRSVPNSLFYNPEDETTTIAQESEIAKQKAAKIEALKAQQRTLEAELATLKQETQEALSQARLSLGKKAESTNEIKELTLAEMGLEKTTPLSAAKAHLENYYGIDVELEHLDLRRKDSWQEIYQRIIQENYATS